jgi:hypothetical protein
MDKVRKPSNSVNFIVIFFYFFCPWDSEMCRCRLFTADLNFIRVSMNAVTCSDVTWRNKSKGNKLPLATKQVFIAGTLLPELSEWNYLRTQHFTQWWRNEHNGLQAWLIFISSLNSVQWQGGNTCSTHGGGEICDMKPENRNREVRTEVYC